MAEDIRAKAGSLVIVSADDLLTAESIKGFEADGFDITVCSDAKKALNLREIKPPRWSPAVIVVDVVMPQTSGFEVVRRLIEQYGTRRIPMLMMSKYNSPEDRAEATNVGASSVIPKPLTPERLREALEKLDAERTKKMRSDMRGIRVDVA